MAKVKPNLSAKDKPGLFRWQAECPVDWASDPRTVTVLCTKNIPATKEYVFRDGSLHKAPPRKLPDGKVVHAKHYYVQLAQPNNIRELADVLKEASEDPYKLVVRGFVVDSPKTPKQTVTRDQKTVRDTARHWLMLDLDGFPLPAEFDWCVDLARTAKWAVEIYLPEFANVAFVYQFSASAGIKPGLRLHLWWWLETPTDSAKLNDHFKPFAERLARRYRDDKAGLEASLDIRVLDSIQEHYIAKPIISGPDPLNGHTRQAFVDAARMTLVLPATSAAPSKSVNGDLLMRDAQVPEERKTLMGWQPTLEDVAGMVPCVIAGYEKLIQEHQSNGGEWWKHPWRRCITALKHHLMRVLTMEEEQAYKWIDESFSKLLPQYDVDGNRKMWGDIAVDLVPERQVTIGTFIRYALDNQWKRPAEAVSAEQEGLLEGVLRDWVYLDALKLFYRFETDDKWDHKQIDNSLPRVFLPNKDPEKPPTVVSMSECLLHRSPNFVKLHSFSYLPGCSDRIVEINRRSRHVKVMNLWMDGDIIAAPGNVQPFLDHVSYLIPDPVERHLFFSALAWTVQRKGKPMFAILWQGLPGTGKSWVISAVEMILGMLNCREVEADEVTSDFNDWLEAVELVVVNEIRDLSSDKRGLMNKFKSLITQPAVRINAKHQKRYEMPTPRVFICMTNEEDPIYIDNDDRRWLILTSPAVPKSADYYDDLFQYSGDLEKVKTGGQLSPEQRTNLGAIKQFLEHYEMEQDFDVQGTTKRVRFNGYGRAPETEGRKELVELSYSDSFKWVREAILNRNWPFTPDVISVQAIVGEPGNLPLNLRSMSARKLITDLRKTGAKQIGNMMLPGTDSTIRCWVVRNIEQWRNAPDKTRGAHWKHHVDLATDIMYASDEGDKRMYEHIQATKRAYLKGRDGRSM